MVCNYLVSSSQQLPTPAINFILQWTTKDIEDPPWFSYRWKMITKGMDLCSFHAASLVKNYVNPSLWWPSSCLRKTMVDHLCLPCPAIEDSVYKIVLDIEYPPVAAYNEEDGHQRDGFMLCCMRLARWKTTTLIPLKGDHLPPYRHSMVDSLPPMT